MAQVEHYPEIRMIDLGNHFHRLRHRRNTESEMWIKRHADIHFPCDLACLPDCLNRRRGHLPHRQFDQGTAIREGLYKCGIHWLCAGIQIDAEHPQAGLIICIHQIL